MRRRFTGVWAHARWILGAAAWLFAACAAAGQTPVSVSPERGAGHVRYVLTWPDRGADAPLGVTASVEHGVLIARFSRPAALDPEAFLSETGPVAAARLDPSGDTLRLALRRPVRPAVSRSYNVVGLDLIDPDRRGDPAPVVSARERAEREAEARRQAREAEQAAEIVTPLPATALPLRVRYAQNSAYTRIIFDWSRPTPFTLNQDGATAKVRFNAAAAPDLGILQADRPNGLVDVTAQRDDDDLVVTFTLDAGYRARAWSDEAAVAVDLFPAPTVKPAAPAAPEPGPAPEPEPQPDTSTPAIVDPVATPPADAPIVMGELISAGGGVDLRFRFPNPVRAAAFERAGAGWVVFGAAARLDIEELTSAGIGPLSRARTIAGETYAAVRAPLPGAARLALRSDDGGRTWIASFAPRVAEASRVITITRTPAPSDTARITANLPNPGAPISLLDPDVGDRIVVIPAAPPSASMRTPRRYVEVRLAPTAHGLVIEPRVDDLDIRVSNDAITMTRPGGLALSPEGPTPKAASRRPTMPGFVDFANWGGPNEDFFERHHAAHAAYAQSPDRANGLALARLYLGHELAAEAYGVLTFLIEENPPLATDPEVRALAGAALTLIGRDLAAAEALSLPTLSKDPGAALWRAVLAANAEDWPAARNEFALGQEAYFFQPEDWRPYFQIAEAEAALYLGDLPAAKSAVEDIVASPTKRAIIERARLVEAGYWEAAGDPERAIATYQDIAADGYEPLEVEALYNVVRLRRALDQIDLAEAAETLEALRIRWRGDDRELAITRELAAIARDSGAHRTAFNLWRSMLARFPAHSAARAVSQDMTDAFRDLFHDGGAALFDPVEALALWSEYRDLTPVGAEGDRMIRRLADRLIAIDLLPQAAELLQHQVDNRLRGAARALVATDLAAVYLLDDDPEAALAVIATTRQPNLPGAINTERRVIQARALAALGRIATAFDLLSTDRSPIAARARADIAWDAGDWAMAGPFLVDALGEAWRRPPPASPDVERDALKAAIAFRLAADNPGLATLVQRYDGLMTASARAPSWRLLTSDPDMSAADLGALAAELAADDTLTAFLNSYRDRATVGETPTG